MSSSRLSGYRQHPRAADTSADDDEHPGTGNYPADESSEYRGIGSSERPRISSAYVPEYKSGRQYRSSQDLDTDLEERYGRGSGGYSSDSFAADRYRVGSTDHTPADHSAGGYAQADYAPDEYDADYDDWDDYDEPDRRWRWVAIAAGIVLLVAVLITVMVVNSGDDTQTAATTDSAEPRTVIATAPPVQDVAPTSAPAPAPTDSLAPETVTTVTPAPPAEPAPEQAAAPPAEEAAPPPAPAPGTITYQVTGSRQLFDLVSIIYTDEQGLPRTDVNVALPWTRTLVLNPGVTTMSVTATSVSGQLNCSITDAAGAVILAQTNNVMISTCTI